MALNTEHYLKEIQSVTTKNLIENREISGLIAEQNELMKINNQLLEDLLFEIKDIVYQMKNN